jgi:acetylornithine deacetylase/succinyl-diaminopimelate desuccinylase-like protein
MEEGTAERAQAERLGTPAVEAARSYIRETDETTLADMLELVAVPAPSFGEAERGAAMRERFRRLGLADVVMDEIGNVLARLPGSGALAGDTAPVLVAAHLDTVFPADTPIRVRREHGRIHAPGIADNCRGLAAILAVARAMLHGGVRPAAPLVFVADVGEEGVGDLRGVKHLFREGSPWRAARAFISVDGTGVRRIVTRGVGSRRLRITVEGAGGHSWADWGVPNPVNALGIGISELARISPPRQPRTVLTVGRVSGGTSVNSIPDSAWLELDLRSEAGEPLHDLEARARRIFSQATSEANARRRRGTPALGLTIDLIGDRPTGETASGSAVVRAARAATRAVGETAELVSSSTDANAAMALGIPAIAIGAGGEAGGTHTLDEWYSNEKGPEGVERVLLTILGISGLA